MVGLFDILLISFFFFFKQKTAYEMRISDWSFRRVLFRSCVDGQRHGFSILADDQPRSDRAAIGVILGNECGHGTTFRIGSRSARRRPRTLAGDGTRIADT